MAPNLTAFLVLVFAAACASAAKCADGSSPGSNGCCAATNECPACMITSVSSSSATPSAESTTCVCSSCAGESVTIDATCTYDNCAARGGSGMQMMGCEYCSVGTTGVCMPTQAAVTACSTMMPSVSINSDGLISAKASCDACCPTNVCVTMEDKDKPECAACFACNSKGTACPADSAAASLSSGALGTTLLAVTTTALLRGLLF